MPYVANGYELDVVESIFIRAIGIPPAYPPGCVLLLMACLALFEEYSNEDSEHLRRSQRRVYCLCMKLLTQFYNSNDILKYQAIVETCRCENASKINVLHDSARLAGDPRAGPPKFHKLVGAMASVIVGGITPELPSLYKVARNLRRARLSGQQPPFPASPKELLPFGIENSIRSIINLFMMDSESARVERLDILPLLCKVIQGCRGIIPASLMCVPCLALDLATASAHIVNLADPSGEKAVLLLSIAQTIRFCFHSMDDLELRHFCLNTPNGTPSEIVDRLSTVCSGLPRLRLAAINPGSLRFFDAALDGFAEVGGRIHMVTRLSHDANRFHPLILEDSVALACRRRDSLAFASAATEYFLNAQRCGSPTCRKTHSSEFRGFARCSQCYVVPYCSKPCQATSWKHTVVSHKRICAYFREFREPSTRKSHDKAGKEIQQYMEFFQVGKFEAMRMFSISLSLIVMPLF